MPDLLQLHWHSPYMLALILPWLYLIYRSWHRKMPGFIVGTVIYAKQVKSRRVPHRLPLILEGIAGLALIVALARPQQVASEQPKTLSGVDIMICVDVSGSMEARDVPGADSMNDQELMLRLNSREFPTRLEAATKEIATFVKRRPNDRLGLIAFSGLTLVKCPPTLNHDFLLDQVKSLKTGIMDNVSTNIASPIAAAADRLQESTAPRRVIVLLTDGEHAEPSAASPEQTAEAAAEFGITIHCISLGSPDAYVMEEGFHGPKWHRITHFDPTTLRKIAKASGGAFLKAEDADGMKTVLDTIDQLETTEAQKIQHLNYNEAFQPLVWAAVALIILSTILSATVLLRIP